MRLWQTRLHWEKLARRDPMWAVLTQPGKERNRWSADEFFATGRNEIAALVQDTLAVHPQLHRGSALDFGCGVGRLTQALADHFDAVTGVDISVRMLELARKQNRHGNIRYRHNAAPHLELLPSGSFDLVCSLITLQHIQPDYALRYIAEFVRVLRPDGVAVFQVVTAVPDPGRPSRRRLSFWPPTLWKRARRWIREKMNRVLAVDPLMEMHAIPLQTVLERVHLAGGELVSQRQADSGGPHCPAVKLWVRRRRSPESAAKPTGSGR